MHFKKALGALFHRLLDMLSDHAPVTCIWCGHCESVKIPIRPMVTLIVCSKCKRQILLMGEPNEPRAVNPDSLITDTWLTDTCCIFGCHFMEPYGFVPMADCPVHD